MDWVRWIGWVELGGWGWVQVSAQISAQFSSEICCLRGGGRVRSGSAKIKDQPSANQ